MNSVSCPRCHNAVSALVEVRPEVQNFLIFHQSSDGLLKKVCASCQQSMEDATHDASLIQNRMSPSELGKLQAWNRRIDVLKEGLNLMKADKFEEALPKYHEYTKIIEHVLGVSAANISAQAFAQNAKADEMPIYCLVLWDLIVCNDGRDEAAQQAAATKMLQLVKGTGLRKTLKDRATKFKRKAKNKKFIKKLLKDFRTDRACYVATFAYGHEEAFQVEKFREYRDQVLRKNIWGRSFIQVYYFLSPSLVSLVKFIPGSKTLSRYLLSRLMKMIEHS